MGFGVKKLSFLLVSDLPSPLPTVHQEDEDHPPKKI